MALGNTFELDAAVNVNTFLPGNIGVVNNLTNALDGLSICAGLQGDALNACLIASREPETARTGRGGLEISVGLDHSGLLQAVNTHFGETLGAASGLFGGLTNASGLCALQGNCTWEISRQRRNSGRRGWPSWRCRRYRGPIDRLKRWPRA